MGMWMKGRSIFDFFRSDIWSFSICFFRLWTCEARVPAPNFATNSWSWTIFFLRSTVSCSTRERTWLLARTISS